MKVEGCEEAKADWEKGWAWAKYNPEKTNPDELVKAINENTPFQAEISNSTEKKKKKEHLDHQSFRFDPIACCWSQGGPDGNGVGPLTRAVRSSVATRGPDKRGEES